MNSKERHEIRYQRRKAKREQKKQTACANYDDFDKVFTFDKLYDSKKDCTTNGTGWKESNQKYRLNACVNVTVAYDSLHEGKLKLRKPRTFPMWERGHRREVNSIHISERVIQKCLCKNSLKPLYARSFIYDNGASLKNGGTKKARNRLNCHLERHIRKHGTEGYILIYDFSNYFGNASHKALNDEMRKRVTDERIIAVANAFMKINNPEGIGVDLGSEQSQIQMVGLPNPIDHGIKEILRIKGSARYMDDGYLIHISKDYLKKCLDWIKEKCKELGIILNERKTRIVKLSRGFQFLKWKYKITETGKIVKRLCRQSIVRERRKLKKYRRLVDAGRMTLEKVRQSYRSWRGSARKVSSFRSVQAMDSLYNKLFVFTEDWKGCESHVQGY